MCNVRPGPSLFSNFRERLLPLSYRRSVGVILRIVRHRMVINSPAVFWNSLSGTFLAYCNKIRCSSQPRRIRIHQYRLLRIEVDKNGRPHIGELQLFKSSRASEEKMVLSIFTPLMEQLGQRNSDPRVSMDESPESA
jgi:hypothetical protein